jgi:hypothetical protein
MDLKKYDELRKKINTKDFEGNNKGLDKWLYLFSFVGNLGSIFFSYFLVYPGLLKAITINIVSGTWATVLSFVTANLFLVIFEIIKRYLIKSFSSDYVANSKKLKASIAGWLTVSIAIIFLSFYLSIVGSKNLASTSTYKDNIVENKTMVQKDSLSILYERRKQTYVNDNEALRIINNDLRQKLAETPLGYVTIRSQYQNNVDKNVKIISDNQAEINKIDNQLNQHLAELKTELQDSKSTNKTEDSKNIFLFIIIACFCEVIIFAGVYFREYFEYNLYVINQQKYEKIYLKKDRYRALLSFVYNGGKVAVGDKVISGLALKEIVAEKTNIQNSNKFVDEFLLDMDTLGIFATNGKRRFIGATFQEALNIVENYDEALRVIENMK